MAFDYITSGPPIIGAPVQPSLLFDKDNDVIYVSTMPTRTNAPAWVPVGGSGGFVSVNGVLTSAPNFNNSTPAAPVNTVNVTWQKSGSSISGHVPSFAPGGNDRDIQFKNGSVFDASDLMHWDNIQDFSTVDALILGNESFNPAGYNTRLLVADEFQNADNTGAFASINSSLSLQLTGDQTGPSFANYNASMALRGVADYGTVFCFDLNFTALQTGNMQFGYGVYSAMNVNATVVNSSGYCPVYGAVALNASGTTSQLIGGQFLLQNSGTGTVTQAIGVQAQISNGNVGSITNAYGIKVETPTISGGSITNYWPVFVDDTAHPCYFAGGVMVGSSPSGGPTVIGGSGAPEGVVIAPQGSLYLNSNGGTNTTLYVKESGSGNTGWVAK